MTKDQETFTYLITFSPESPPVYLPAVTKNEGRKKGKEKKGEWSDNTKAGIRLWRRPVDRTAS